MIDCLTEVNNAINGGRQDAHGNPENSFALIADYWNIYLHKIQSNLLIAHGADLRDYKLKPLLTAKDVGNMTILFKMARCSGQKPSRDNYVDIAGYAAIVADRLMGGE